MARLLAYPENPAGSIMTTEFVSVPSTLTVGETLDYVRKVEKTRETIYAIYVLDPKTKILIKPVSLRRLVTGAPQDPVLSVALPRRPITVPPSAGSRRRGQAYLQIRSVGPCRSWISGVTCSASSRSTTSSTR